MKLTKAQRGALIEANGVVKNFNGLRVGGGRVVADTRVERALIRFGLAKGCNGYPFRGSSVWLTDAGRSLAVELSTNAAR